MPVISRAYKCLKSLKKPKCLKLLKFGVFSKDSAHLGVRQLKPGKCQEFRELMKSTVKSNTCVTHDFPNDSEHLSLVKILT